MVRRVCVLSAMRRIASAALAGWDGSQCAAASVAARLAAASISVQVERVSACSKARAASQAKAISAQRASAKYRMVRRDVNRWRDIWTSSLGMNWACRVARPAAQFVLGMRGVGAPRTTLRVQSNSKFAEKKELRGRPGSAGSGDPRTTGERHHWGTRTRRFASDCLLVAGECCFAAVGGCRVKVKMARSLGESSKCGCFAPLCTDCEEELKGANMLNDRKNRSGAWVISLLVCVHGIPFVDAEDGSKTATAIPLNAAWAINMKGSRGFLGLDPSCPPDINPASLVNEIRAVLADQAPKDGQSGFIVLGKGSAALQPAHAVLVNHQAAINPIPADSDVSLVFFAYAAKFSARLIEVAIDGSKINVRYEVMPRADKELSESIAFVPLGKFARGDYHVELVKAPLDPKFAAQGLSLPSDDEIRQCIGRGFDFSVESTDVKLDDLGQLAGIPEFENRLGGVNRMFLIEDEWELARCSRLIPELPKIDLSKESLLAVMTWEARPRSIRSAHAEGQTLVIGAEEPQRKEAHADSHRSPKLLVYRMAKWDGPVRFELNGMPQFTIERGEKLTQRVDELWEEVLRLHSGAKPNRLELILLLRSNNVGLTDDEAIKLVTEDKLRYQSISNKELYPIVFRELSDLKARSAIGRLFKLIDSMGQFDPAEEPAWQAIVAIGGPDVVGECKAALKSPNRRSRAAATSILWRIADPETRTFAWDCLDSTDWESARGAIMLLKALGFKREDVPALIHRIERIEGLWKTAHEEGRVEGYQGSLSDDMNEPIWALGTLGSAGEEAIPTLERIANDPKYGPPVGLQQKAQEAINKIRGNADSAPH